jgi:hypothetical protein
VLPFLARIQTREAMIEHLEAQDVTGRATGIEKCQFAALKYRVGDTDVANRVLDDLARKGPPWSERTHEVRRRLGCA